MPSDHARRYFQQGMQSTYLFDIPDRERIVKETWKTLLSVKKTRISHSKQKATAIHCDSLNYLSTTLFCQDIQIDEKY